VAEEFRESVFGLTLVYAAARLPSITISGGVANHREGGAGAIEMLKVAVEVLYRAKESGRDCVFDADRKTEIAITDAFSGKTQGLRCKGGA
jgi:PleD family two-component response regulator